MLEDYIEYIPKQKKNLAEDSFRISISDFGKKLLYSSTSNKDAFVYGHKGKQGSFVISNGLEKVYVSYCVNLNKTPRTIELFFKKSTDSLSGIDQRIEIEEDIATFGIRPFFKCQCGKNATVLYMPKNKNFFSCRDCANIIYESQRLNKHTMNGLFYYSSRLLKLFEAREKIDRMFYAGKLSRKGKKLMEKYDRFSKDIDIETRCKAEEHLLSIMSGHRKGFKEEIEQFM